MKERMRKKTARMRLELYYGGSDASAERRLVRALKQLHTWRHFCGYTVSAWRGHRDFVSIPAVKELVNNQGGSLSRFHPGYRQYLKRAKRATLRGE